MKNTILLFILLAMPGLIFGQSVTNDSTLASKKVNWKSHCTPLIIPALLCAYGITALNKHNYLNYINREVHHELQEGFAEQNTIDDYTQYVPTAAVYGLNAIGLHGKNNFRDRTMIIGISHLLMIGTVRILKTNVPEMRPDGSKMNSFPSGHTATAFCGAEFLWMEYKDVNPWIAASGFLVAAGTGYLRIYNQRHWVSDVAMGAAIGILSTRVAYWIYPAIQEKLFKSGKDNIAVMPYYNGKEVGLGMMMNIN